MSTKHTPGPWRLSNYHYPHSEIVADRGSSDNDSRPGVRLICRTADNGKSPPEFKANARLIAASPCLLEACKEAFKKLSPKGDIKKDFSGHVAMSLLSKAIAKATN